MNELGPQQYIAAKARTSAPDVQTGMKKDQGGKPPTVSPADVLKAEQAGSVSQVTQEKEAKAQDEQIEKAVAQLNDYVQNSERKLEFQLDEESGHTVVRVYDKASEELIRQIPNEEALELAQKLNQEEPLMLFSANV